MLTDAPGSSCASWSSQDVVQIGFAKATSITVSGGRLAFIRIVPASEDTVEADREGRFILGPGSNFTIHAQDLKAGQLFRCLRLVRGRRLTPGRCRSAPLRRRGLLP